MGHDDRPMHASIWTFRGDPDDLLTRYDAMTADIGPENLLIHLCLRTPDGIVVVDACPTREDWEAFIASPQTAALLARHGLPAPEISAHPVHAAHVAAQPTPA